MFILKRILIWLIPFFWFIGIELIGASHDFWWWIVGVFTFLLIFTVWFLGKMKFNKVFFNFLILPLVFCLSSLVFLTFLVSTTFFHVFAFLTAALLYLLLKQNLIYFNFPYKYQPYSLEILSLYLSILSGYFLFSSLFAGLTLIKLPMLVMGAFLVLIIGFLTYQFFWIHKIDFSKGWLFIFVIALSLTELFVAVSYLPTSYYVNAFILIVGYYLMLSFSKFYIQSNLTKDRIVRYLIIASVTVLAVLITAQWY